MTRILVVDDEPGMRTGLAEVLGRQGYAVTAVENAPAALTALEEGGYALVISDMRMPGMSGSELLAAVQARHPALPMVMITAYGTVEDAVADLGVEIDRVPVTGPRLFDRLRRARRGPGGAG